MRNTLIALAAMTTLAAGARAVGADKVKHAHAPKRIEITVTEDGFSPSKLFVKRNQPVVLAVTRKTDKTCATKVIVHVSKEKTVEKKLPLNKTVEIPVTFEQSGELRYACGMDHVSGVIQVQ